MNKKKIIRALEYCGMSYADFQPKLPGESIIMIDDKKTDIQCFLRTRGDSLTIVFRGSDSQKDRETDAKFWKTVVPYNNYSSKIRVHAGFISTYKSRGVRKKIHGVINDSVKKIVVTGHSYGAALAILCAVDLEYNFPEKDYEVIVFGCPRVGNKAFKESYDLRIFKTLRVENFHDVVTKVPFVLMGYRHVGARLEIGKNRHIPFFSMKSHNLQEYYSNIWDA